MADQEPKKLTKTEQGRADRVAEKAARATATQNRRDSAAAAQKRSEQRVGSGGGDGGTSERMSQREAASGLNLAGNNTMSGRGQPMPTMSEREEAAGLNLAGNDTLSGRGDSFYQFSTDLPGTDEPIDQGVHDQTNDVLPVSQSAFAAIICVNGKPHYASIQGEIGDEIT
tara:strand:+ start:242 stop:751 length:510 start_codon:yes stop_codon:yes gene_type:complete